MKLSPLLSENGKRYAKDFNFKLTDNKISSHEFSVINHIGQILFSRYRKSGRGKERSRG